jgi:hypothetical protein
MLQCYVLTCGRSVTAFLAPPRSQRPGQGSRSPHPKAGPETKPRVICTSRHVRRDIYHSVAKRRTRHLSRFALQQSWIRGAKSFDGFPLFTSYSLSIVEERS